jgi:Uma2 family endonuclease
VIKRFFGHNEFMSLSTSTVTADQLLRLPDDGHRYELVAGELKMMSPSGFEHGFVVVRLTLPLAQHVQEQGLGCVLGAETGFRIAENPDTVRAPDISFVRQERIPAEELPKSFLTGAPDLAVEVISPSDTFQQVDEKITAWLAAGCSAVWLFDPRLRTVTVHRSATEITTLTEKDTLDGGDVVPGFQCPIKTIFELPLGMREE